MGRKKKDRVAPKFAKKNPRVVVGKFTDRAGADRAAKKIMDSLGWEALTITQQDGVEVWTVRKPTVS